MKSILGFLILLLATAHALPYNEGDTPLFPVPDSLTVEEASSKCGTQAQLSCCNEGKYVGNTTSIGGTLSNLLGAGSGAEGLGLFSQCSKLDIPIIIDLQDLVNQQCKQNIVCCDHSGGGALPCLALGSIL
ncbi:hypothetical protein BJX99DRAFT_253437 [Aspergillus californicus]